MPEAPASHRPRLVREISAQFDGEWLLIKIMDTTSPPGDSLALLLAHSPDWGEVFKANRKARKQEPSAPLWILQGGTTFGNGETLRQSLVRVTEEEWASVNRW